MVQIEGSPRAFDVQEIETTYLTVCGCSTLHWLLAPVHERALRKDAEWGRILLDDCDCVGQELGVTVIGDAPRQGFNCVPGCGVN